MMDIEEKLPETVDDLKKEIEKIKINQSDCRFQRADRETELLIVFRELMQIDIFAHESYFDGDRLTRQGLGKSDNQSYNDVPLKTFWIPSYQYENYVDPNSEEALPYHA